MKLLIDMGNSRLKSAVLGDSGSLLDINATAYEAAKPIDVFKGFVSNHKNITSVTIVSVLGEEFQRQLDDFFLNVPTQLNRAASTASAFGVTNRYREPEKLGSDRFVALVAAKAQFPATPCIVIDCGTAVTIDALSASGEFCGGVIIPGLALWSQSLVKRADQLHEHQIDDLNLFARDTAQAIGSGSLYGLTSAIEGIVQRMSQQLSIEFPDEKGPECIICGGDAAMIASHSSLPFSVMPNLVLMGLAEYT